MINSLTLQDRLIIATAIPAITDEFRSMSDVGWYGGAYLVTSCTFILLYGKVYTLFSIKRSYMSAIFLFLIGSALCGAARNSHSFIFGRAVAGLGSAGISSGTQVLIVLTVPPQSLPIYLGFMGAVYGLASVMGPLVGGALTTTASWRWCFWLNLPIGAAAIAAIWFLVDDPINPKATKLNTKEKILQLDLWGNMAFIPGIISLILGLQMGGTRYSWNSPVIITLLTMSYVLFIVFTLIQVLRSDTATVAPRIFKQRSIFFGFLASFFGGASQMLFIYYLPIWFQGVQNMNALDSGKRTLPLVAALVAANILSGITTNKIGHYLFPMLIGVICMSIGAGLITTLELHTRTVDWMTHQLLYGWGLGCMSPAPVLAARAALPRADVSIGLALMRFAQNLGGVIFLPVAGTILTNELATGLAAVRPDLDAAALLQSIGVTTITKLPREEKEVILAVYNSSLRSVFYVGLVVTCLTAIGPIGMEWINVKDTERREQLKQGDNEEEKQHLTSEHEDTGDSTDEEDEEDEQIG
ncbi:putative HC-toxin efflux carrier TOXA 26 [Colletotrichum chlorophyti]|uniref:Putative HC-toxin efflux carrier TOXA 26 n=1 Tax=Colletotrichum chlorophyti TaxID=708187 RepID=A0A1Q8RX17_9PEZI|nr:putative HC-toxin efflux carrier TOXA 26 [Colletotrichum chlorophyti]